MTGTEVSTEKTRPSLGRQIMGVLFRAFVGVAILQAVVAFVWNYNGLWVILLWVMILLIATMALLMVAILIADQRRLTQVSQHIHETPPGGDHGNS